MTSKKSPQEPKVRFESAVQILAEPFPLHALEGNESENSSPLQGSLSLGRELDDVPDLVHTLEYARSKSFEFVCVPLAISDHQRDLISEPKSQEPWTRSDMILTTSQWANHVVGKISTWIQLDSTEDRTRRNSRKALQQELSWASHLTLSSLILPTPLYNCGNYAQAINQTLQNLVYMQIWVRIPLMSTAQLQQEEEEEKPSVETLRADPWEWWNNLRTLCDSHANLSVALEVTEDLPSPEVLAKWLGEPVRALIIPTTIFLTNQSGYPALSKKHKHFVAAFFKFKVQLILKGEPIHQANDNKDPILLYQMYLNWLYTNMPPFTENDQFEIPYYDFLQAPLQPLQDNLEAQTYETFERDAIKYKKYQEAIYKYLLSKPEDQNIVLMVVGAGRGPLVRASLRAAESAKRNIKVYAVEKNPNAVITLRNHAINLKWGNKVTIVDSDMRLWDAPEKADVLVSELLGSFGDNELSPECLDGAQRFLKEDGVSIPASYTSLVAPISSSKLWNEVRNWKDLKHFETPYVVKLHNINQLAEAKECFTFVHPNKEIPIDNSRYIKLSFQTKESATLHGFAGYFETKLFDDVYLSINPRTLTKGMFSWFPIYFPIRLKEPIYIPAESEIEVHFWRNCSRVKVWYEWAISSPSHCPIHNPNGRSYWIGT